MPASATHVREQLDASAAWVRIDKKGDPHGIMVPQWVPGHLIDRGMWPFPPLRGVVETPMLRPDGTVLDAPAGFGHLSMKLRDMGFDVVRGEIDPEIFSVPDLDVVYTDLNRRIDAADGAFDYVACVDGLEHMTDPYTAVAEFARRRGVGQAMVNRCLSRLREAGIIKCHALVFRENRFGELFWTPTGWDLRQKVSLYSRFV